MAITMSYTEREACLVRDALTDRVVELKQARRAGRVAGALEDIQALRDDLAAQIVRKRW